MVSPVSLADHKYTPQNQASRWARWGLGLLLGSLLCFGGGGCNKPTAKTEKDDKAAHKHTPEEEEVDEQGRPLIPLRKEVREFPGIWCLTLFHTDQLQNPKENHIWLMDIKDEGGNFTCQLIDTTNDPHSPKLKTFSIDKDRLSMTFDTDMGEGEFIGNLHNDFIWGSFAVGGLDVMCARMKPTTTDRMEKYAASSKIPGTEQLRQSMTDPKTMLDTALKFSTRFPANPYTIMNLQKVFLQLNNVQQLVKKRFDEKEMTQFCDFYRQVGEFWGPLMEATVEVNVARGLILSGTFPELALKHLDHAEELLGPRLERRREELTALRSTAEMSRELQRLTDAESSTETKQAAYSALQTMLPRHPRTVGILYNLALYADSIQETDRVIEYLTTLIAIPRMEITTDSINKANPNNKEIPVRKLLEKNWQLKHGSLAGLEDAILAEYQKQIDAMAADARKKAPPLPSRDSSSHKALIEIFTGTGCIPCIAANLAIDAAVEEAPDQTILLQYHQPIPVPDPLANFDSEDRFNWYKIRGCPTVVIDGQPCVDGRGQPVIAGDTTLVTQSYGALRLFLDEKIKSVNDVQVNLSAIANGGEIEITAEASGISDEELSGCRLRLAIAEEIVPYQGPNEIRFHRMVVRTLIGGNKGIAPKDGALKYVGKISLAELQQRQLDFFAQSESTNKIKFDAKPLQLKPLRLVGWVQNDVPNAVQLRMVLQSASVPVTGELTYPALPESDASKPALKDDDVPPAVDQSSNKSPAEKPAAPAPEPAP